MLPRLIITLLVCFAATSVSAQYSFLLPSHYHGIYSDQLSSARAQGMGYTTITLDGIATSPYNPATISPGTHPLDIAVNYAKGSPQFPKSYYPFVGISYKVLPKLTVGASMFAWIDPDSYWNAVIANQTIETDKKTQHLYSVVAAYQVLDGLHIGVSGNYLTGSAVRGTVTDKNFILNTGAIYDRSLKLIKTEKITGQEIRLAASLSNTLMKPLGHQKYEDLLNYRDLPIILRGGLGYHFSIPVRAAFAKKSKFFSKEPEIVDLSLRLQFQDWLKHRKHIFKDAEFNTAFGIGAEAWFMQMLAFRLGYYTESRPSEGNPGDIVVTEPRKKGITWGLGANLPLKRLTAGKLPVDVEVNLVTQRMMSELKEIFPNTDLRDRRFQFCLGLNVRWGR